MNTIYWHMNAKYGGANLHPVVNLLPGANLHPGANCAHEHGLNSGHKQYKFHQPAVRGNNCVYFNVIITIK